MTVPPLLARPPARPPRRAAAAARAVRWTVLLSVLSGFYGCVTPPAVKQAVTSLDQGYAENLEMMSQYRALVAQTNQRYELWSRYVQSRGLLNLAVKWATTDPVANEAAERAAARVDMESRLLGPDLVKLVNGIRLKGLPARSGAAGAVFEPNDKGTMTGVVEALPGLVNAVGRRVDERIAELASNDLSGFDAYATNVSALRQINATIKSYLDIDVTVKPEDLNEITQAIRGLRQ